MKKLSLSFMALVVCLIVNAQNAMPNQVWQKSPILKMNQGVKPLEARFMEAKATITPNENQMWWGYFNGSDEWYSVGTGKNETYDAAIYIPAGHGFVGKSTISAIRVYIEDVSSVSDLKVWISRASLPGEVSNADFFMNIDVSSLVTGPNDIALPTPFVVNDEAIYVGYTIIGGGYPIAQGGSYVDNSLYLRSSQSITEWGIVDYLGCLALQILIESSEFPQNMASPSKFKSSVVELGKTTDIMVEIENGGSNTIENISYTVSSDGNTSAEKTINNIYIPYGAKVKIPVPFDADSQEGKVLKTLTITKVNGNENVAEEKTATGYLQTVTLLKTYPRTTLIEEFTTEYCGWCPTAASELSSTMTTYPELASQVAIVCHHSGYGTDWLTIEADNYYTWFYNDGGRVYAPAFMWDRFADNGKTPVTSRLGEPIYYKSILENRLAKPAYVSLDMTANFNEDKDKIIVNTNCERAWEFCDVPPRITLILTEDNIEAHSQSGANGSFTHQHVSRAVNEVWGSVLKWDNNKASYSYIFDLDPSWKRDDLKVVAFISGYDSSDPTNCAVENAVVKVPENDATVTQKGDADGNGSVDVKDVVAMVNFLKGNSPTVFDNSLADMNGDGKVDIGDIIMLVNWLLSSK